MSGPFLLIVILGCFVWFFAILMMLCGWVQTKDALVGEFLRLFGIGIVLYLLILIMLSHGWFFSAHNSRLIAVAAVMTAYLGYFGLRLYRHVDKTALFRSFCRLFCPGFLLSLPVAGAIPLGFLIDNDGLGVLWGIAAATGLPWNGFFLLITDMVNQCEWYNDIFRFAAIHKYFPKQCYADQGFVIYLTLPVLYASCIGAHINGMFLFRAWRRRRERQAENDNLEQP